MHTLLAILTAAVLFQPAPAKPRVYLGPVPEDLDGDVGTYRRQARKLLELTAEWIDVNRAALAAKGAK
jgi:hypothetical protein